MFKIKVQLLVVSAALPLGIVYDHTDIDVTDGDGTTSSQVVNGSEVDSWSAQFDVSAGTGVARATAKDTDGNAIGNPIQANFVVKDTPVETLYPAPNGISVSQLS